MHIAIAGGTGYVGTQLTKALLKRGDDVSILTRSPEKYQNKQNLTYVGWLKSEHDPAKELDEVDAVINLAGDSLFGYWTDEKKKKIVKSRYKATNAIVSLINKMETKPDVLVNVSAVGYFGNSEMDVFTEEEQVPGDDFLANVAKAWEEEAKKANALGVRTVLARLGVVLGKEGALPLMAMPFKLFIGGKIGSGKQWISWIHIEDVVGMILFAIDNDGVDGPLHVTAPEPMQNDQFSQILATVLDRPNWLPVPSIAIKLLLGEMSTLVIDGQHVLPEKAEKNGYHFAYPKLASALKNIYKK
ncbi:TIGR01777 family oxidoreductase [Saliterribacillus persicus]|uniref:TIGR01777 family protein n=1 Tax=Saliterribacillus persicus TaxID=930114 RepID=A0A368X496_9BACI|nr:TIGR01777 family oxidoreductase [Saliterribacillus persicus]RCW62841.1 hypothetical protein DFR57_12210 [Saliterribacillus persicus]